MVIQNYLSTYYESVTFLDVWDILVKKPDKHRIVSVKLLCSSAKFTQFAENLLVEIS